ncbi:MAG: DUF4974 domain-containing protein [Pseudoflavonifractor sp.]|nr:DUF4974 domain-containing protein [Alloprevotella sp.]MCM1117327.1 DUF4974 domain-containing protein [Pseudoflavonifractor sp.]
MDKFDRLLDAIEHTDSYSDEDLLEMLSDPELRIAYHLMAASRSYMAKKPVPETDSEWQRFAACHLHNQQRPLLSRLLGRRLSAAAITTAVVSLAAVAAGISFSVISPSSKSEAMVSDHPASSDVSIARAPYSIALVAPTDSATVVSVITFKDKSLAEILNVICRHYGAEVVYKGKNSRQLRLFFNWDPSLSIDEVVGQLNNFEQIDINLNGSKIVVN